MLAPARELNIRIACLLDCSPPSAPRAPLATQDYANCEEYATCRSEGFHCYKRAGVAFAQCRPETGTRCVEAGLWDPTQHSLTDWLCPGWEYCAARHGNCAYSRCCQNAYDACLTRHENYAQCIPAYGNVSLVAVPVGVPDNRVALAEQAACADLKAMGWECQKMIPETTTCSHDCTPTPLASRRHLHATHIFHMHTKPNSCML